MGQSLNPMRTHTDVPDDVKDKIAPVDYEPCPEDQREHDCEACDDCGDTFGWTCGSTNCDWCGRQLCNRCCPPRYLLHNNPGCAACTRKAYRVRRTEMLSDHYEEYSVRHPSSQVSQGMPTSASEHKVVDGTVVTAAAQ